MASRGSWVTSSRVPSKEARWRRRSRRTSVRVAASRAARGSSRSSSRGSPAMARARATRWAWPPDRARGRAPAWPARPTRSSQPAARRRASALGRPRARSPKATSSRTVPSRLTRPRASGTSPARARSRVVLPAPFGPSSTTSSPVATTSSTSRSSSPRARPRSASRLTGAPLRGSPDPSGSCRREPAVAQDDQYGQGDGQQDQAEGDGRLQVGLQGQVDGQGHGLGDPGEVAGEGDGGPELAQGPGPAQGDPGPEGGGDQGQGDPGEGPPAAGPQGGGGVLVAPVHGPEPGLAGDDQERHGHERLGQDGPGGGEGQG